MTTLIRISLLSSALFLAFCFQDVVWAQPENSALQQIQAALDWNDSRYLGKLLKQYLGKKVTLEELRRVAQSHNSEALSRAIEATTGFYGTHKEILGVKRADFLQMALFIENSLREFINRRQYYLPAEQTGLEFPLEYDHQTRKTFIILPQNKQTYIGAGKNKIVMKAVFYNEKKSEVVARAVQTKVREIEMKTTNELRGTTGIMDVLACTTFKKNNEVFCTIYTRLYAPGSLSRAFSQRFRFTCYEKMKIALNILKGLSELHKRDIAHRDVSPQNCLIHIPPGKAGQRDIVAVIADLGRADSIWKNYPIKLRIQGHSCYTPPEGIFKGRVKGLDFLKSDVYAIGCIFYQLFYGKAAPWLSTKYVMNTSKSEFSRYRGLATKIYRYTNSRKSLLARKITKGKISTSEAFEHLILRMVDHSAEKRGSAMGLYTELQRIYEAHTKTNRK